MIPIVVGCAAAADAVRQSKTSAFQGMESAPYRAQLIGGQSSRSPQATIVAMSLADACTFTW
jgi:hypothetical protein